MARPRRAVFFLATAVILFTSPAPVYSMSVDEVLADMEKVVVASPRQDRQGVEALVSSVQGHYMELRLHPFARRKRLLVVVKDKEKDWRFRRLAAMGLAMDDDKSLAAPLLRIVNDPGEADGVRGGAAIGLSMVAVKHESVCRELNKSLGGGNHSRDLLDDIMTVIGACGCDDIDLMSKLQKEPAKGLNQIGLNFNSIRCLVASTNPKAVERLAEIILDEPDKSYTRGVALEEMLQVARHRPKEFEKVAPRLVEPVLKLLEVETFGQGNLDDLIVLLGKTRDSRAVDPLLTIMRDTRHTVIVWRCVEALGEIGDTRALPALEQLWKGIPADPRNDYGLRSYYKAWKEGRRDKFVPALRKAILQMGGKLDPPEHQL
ncbi:MAG: HEAT repeat domain-containing protein [Bryobacteraceae bacterium]|nr:HEAT repeat domain-containing protein [Bryobacteraceae bacterium]